MPEASPSSPTPSAPDGPATMRAALADRYGGPEALRVAQAPRPAIRADEVLVRVAAAAINPGDLFTLLGSPAVARLASGLARPRNPVPGRALVGTVTATGDAVTRFRRGDAVFGEATGGLAEYAAVPERLLAAAPRALSAEQAAALPLAGVTALQALRAGGRPLGPGSRVLVTRASGGVGVLAIQLARLAGAEVTASCGARNLGLVTRLGATEALDYAREDPLAEPGRYDLILDLVGDRPLPALRRALAPGGALVLSSGPPSPTLRRILLSQLQAPFVRGRVVPLLQSASVADLEELARLADAGGLEPVIDEVFPLELAADAFRRQQSGHGTGRVVVRVA